MDLMAHIEAGITKAKADHPCIHLFAVRGAYCIEINAAGVQHAVAYSDTPEAADAVLSKAVASAAARIRTATPAAVKTPQGRSTRRTPERRWDNLYNEGGHGYNPHRAPEE
jgi:hypothetical protein